MDSLTLTERKAIDALLKKHNDFITHCSKWNLIQDKDKKKKGSELCYLMIGNSRLYTMLSGGKSKGTKDYHFLELLGMESNGVNQVFLKMSTSTIGLECPEDTPSKQTEEFLIELFRALVKSFPAMLQSFHVQISDPECLKKMRASAMEAVGRLKCGGYVHTYECICDFLGLSIQSEIAWDIENLFYLNDVTEFNLNEIALRQDKLSLSDFRALLVALRYNCYFTGLVVDFKLEKEVIGYVIDTLQHNQTIKKLMLKDVGLFRDQVASLAHVIQGNPFMTLTHIDLSNNQMEDKGATSFGIYLTACKHPIFTINFTNCKISSTGILAIATAIENNEAINQTLTSLSLGWNKIDHESARALAKVYSKTINLKELNLPGSGSDFYSLKKNDNLMTIDVSNNKITTKDSKHLDLVRFLQNATRLKTLNLSNTGISMEILKQILDNVPNLEELDLSDNQFNDAHLMQLVDVLASAPQLKALNIGKNFEKKSNQRDKAMQKFSDYLNSSGIEKLYLVGNPKMPLKRSIIPIVVGLMNNRTIKVLDVSGNQCGNTLAIALGKVLQTNESLDALYWDDNNTTLPGFLVFKNGLQRNKTLRLCPQPTNDIYNAMKNLDKNNYIVDALREIQEMIAENLQTKVDSIPASTPVSEAPAKSTTDAEDKGLSKANNRKSRYGALDVSRASTLLSRPEDLLNAASDELSEEELAQLKKIMPTSQEEKHFERLHRFESVADMEPPSFLEKKEEKDPEDEIKKTESPKETKEPVKFPKKDPPLPPKKPDGLAKGRERSYTLDKSETLNSTTMRDRSNTMEKQSSPSPLSVSQKLPPTTKELPKPPSKLPSGATPLFPGMQPPKRNPPVVPPKSKTIEWSGDAIPVVISKCIEYIEKNGINEEGIYRESANAKQLQELKAAFDNGTDVDLSTVKDPNVIAGLLKLYFRNLEQPLFILDGDGKEFSEALATENKTEKAAKLQSLIKKRVLENRHKLVFALFSHLKKIAENSATNKMTPYNLSICFAPTLFRSGADIAPVLETIIADYEQIFCASYD